MNDAGRLRRDPAMRWAVGGRAVREAAASASQMGRFETEWLTRPENLAALGNLPGRWIDRAQPAPAEPAVHRAGSLAPVPDLDCHTGPDRWTLPRTVRASGECRLEGGDVRCSIHSWEWTCRGCCGSARRSGAIIPF